MLFLASEATLKAGLKIPIHPTLKLKIEKAEIRPSLSIGNHPASFSVTDDFQRMLGNLIPEAYINGTRLINFIVDLSDYDDESEYIGVYKNALVQLGF